MDFEDFLPENSELNEEIKINLNPEKIGSEQVYDVITSRKPDWQQVIYDLIASEQLDPWDIDIILLTRKYFEKIALLEEQDFYISSKVLLAAALLLRIKSEFLLNKHIKSIDDILFGKKEDTRYVMERIQIDENELPLLVPRTPMPRLRKVTLDELMSALNKAINTETRRIKREIAIRRAKKLSEVDFPTFTRIDLKDRIRQFYARILTSLKKIKVSEKESNKVGFTNLAGREKEQKISSFLPLLHLSNSKKLWLEQENHLEEIWIYLYDYFDKNRNNFLKDLMVDDSLNEDFDSTVELIEDDVARNMNLAEKEILENLNKEIVNSEKISEEEEKEIIRNEIIREIESEEKELETEEKIDESTGF
jgi:segregation and condensation protein A